jgi:uncharacterized protein (DUF305 family)
MDNVVKRTLWLLVISTAVVLVALVFGQPESLEGPTQTNEDHSLHADVHSEATFIAGMIPHHQEAVDSARELLGITERPEMRELARAVIDVQSEEIALLEGWLESWYPDAEPDPDYQPMMRDLEGLSPAEAERTFLEDMIMHHLMAIAMAQAYLDGEFEKRPEVAAMAEEIVSVQDEEIARMQAWLEDWYGPADADHQDH